MFESIRDYIVVGTQDRIQEAIYNFIKLKEHYGKAQKAESFDSFIFWLDEFRYLFNNYLISVMSIKDTLDKDYNKIDGYKDWWNEKINEIKEEFSINFLSLRNAHQHENNGFITYVISLEKEPTLITLHLDYSYPRDQIITSISTKFNTSKEDQRLLKWKEAESVLIRNRDSIPSLEKPKDSIFDDAVMKDKNEKEVPMKFFFLKQGLEQQQELQGTLIREGKTYLTGMIIKSRDEIIAPDDFIIICKNLIKKFESIGSEAYKNLYPKINKKKK